MVDPALACVRPRRRSLLASALMLGAAGGLSLPRTAQASGRQTLGPSVPLTPAQTTTTHFSTSYEDGDPGLDYELEPEAGPGGTPLLEGIVGPDPTGMPGSLHRHITAITASAENGPGEDARKLADESPDTKWLAFETSGWVTYEMDEEVTAALYQVTSGNDAPERDPAAWQLLGSADGKDWAVLDKRSDVSFDERRHTLEFEVAEPGSYRFYRFEVLANHGADIIQVADVTLSDGSAHPEPAPSAVVEGSTGPTSAHAANAGVGFTGVRSLFYGGKVVGAEGGHAWMRLHDVEIPVGPDTELSYRIFPTFTDDLSYASTFASIDLHFTDGTLLSDLEAVDQYGFGASPRAQGDAKALWAGHWNHRAIRLGEVAAGRTIDRILFAADCPLPEVTLSGWIDDVTIADRPVESHDRPSDWVDTRRGTHASTAYSRGLTIPATAVPHGFNFWIPVTNAGSVGSPYAYHHHNDEQNRSRIQAFAISHAPSPWMGDRNIVQVMPASSADAPAVGRQERSLAFTHEQETALPHRYAVELEGGIRAEIAPTDHAALLRFTFEDGQAHLIFDNASADGGLTLAQDGTISGFTDTRSGGSAGATRMFFHGRVDAPVTAAQMVEGDPGGEVTGYLSLAVAPGEAVTLRLASSLISVEQAARNLELEISADDTIESVAERAQQQWDERLEVIEVGGASPDQLRTLYSNLYRLSLYPNSGYENTGTADAPQHRYASPVSEAEGESTPTQTGARIVDGKILVNNGFWDTYRTVWPAYALFHPAEAPELVDGFVQQHRDGGWVARWSSPGYANLMTGTSSDVAFADIATKGIELLDPVATYEAGLRNATVVPSTKHPNNPSVGRKGLHRSAFLGWTTTDVSEGLSWALEGYINDYALAQQAALLATDDSLSAADRERFAAESTYLRNRCLMYPKMFDAQVDFFQGRAADGTFRRPAGEYDPRDWGMHDYTETNGWNFAFHVPFDPAGLAELYGSREALIEKLEEFYSTPETGTFPGSYGGGIHEMREARDVRMGMWGFSNQVSHHIPFTYAAIGAPERTQEITREVLSRCFVGGDLGQGYAGDEDNGETSAWWLFTAMGLYPYQLGSGTYIITAPLFEQATIRPRGGQPITIIARGTSAGNVYIQSLRVNGEAWDKPWIEHAVLAKGAQLEFEMGPEPSTWGTDPESAPPSPSTDPKLERHTDLLRGLTVQVEGVDAAALTDDNALTGVELPGDAVLSVSFEKPRHLAQYTLTCTAADAAPSAWVLETSPNGKTWMQLDAREGEEFRWDRQLRPFTPAESRGAKRHYRIRLLGKASQTVTLAQLELLGR